MGVHALRGMQGIGSALILNLRVGPRLRNLPCLMTGALGTGDDGWIRVAGFIAVVRLACRPFARSSSLAHLRAERPRDAISLTPLQLLAAGVFSDSLSCSRFPALLEEMIAIRQSVVPWRRSTRHDWGDFWCSERFVMVRGGCRVLRLPCRGRTGSERTGGWGWILGSSG